MAVFIHKIKTITRYHIPAENPPSENTPEDNTPQKYPRAQNKVYQIMEILFELSFFFLQGGGGILALVYYVPLTQVHDV